MFLSGTRPAIRGRPRNRIVSARLLNRINVAVQVLAVTAGTIEVHVDGESPRGLFQGDMIRIKSDLMHGFKNIGSVPHRSLKYSARREGIADAQALV